jgi:hypothetical protein
MTYDRYAQCDATCTTDCGACKGQGRPAPSSAAGMGRAIAASEQRDAERRARNEGWLPAPSPAAAAVNRPEPTEADRERAMAAIGFGGLEPRYLGDAERETFEIVVQALAEQRAVLTGSMKALQADAWDRGYRACEKGTQRFRNPYRADELPEALRLDGEL